MNDKVLTRNVLVEKIPHFLVKITNGQFYGMSSVEGDYFVRQFNAEDFLSFTGKMAVDEDKQINEFFIITRGEYTNKVIVRYDTITLK